MRNRRRNRRARQRNNNPNRNVRNISLPAGRTRQIRTGVPLKTLTLSHREYVMDLVSGVGTSTVTSVECNPGLEGTFPWLSAIAARFETYQFISLSFEYIPVVGTTTDGAVAFCPDYDAADHNEESSKQRLMSFEDTKRGPVWNPMVMSCTGSNLRKMKEYFVRNTGLGQNLDIKTYDPLKLYVVLSAYESTSKFMGELWVSYKIKLITPQLEPILPEVGVFQQKTGHHAGEADPFEELEKIEGDLSAHIEDTQTVEVTDLNGFGKHLLVSLFGDLHDPLGTPTPILSIFPLETPDPSTILKEVDVTQPNDTGQVNLHTLVQLASDTSESKPAQLRWPGPVSPGGASGIFNKLRLILTPVSKDIWDSVPFSTFAERRRAVSEVIRSEKLSIRESSDLMRQLREGDTDKDPDLKGQKGWSMVKSRPSK